MNLITIHKFRGHWSVLMKIKTGMKTDKTNQVQNLIIFITEQSADGKTETCPPEKK